MNSNLKIMFKRVAGCGDLPIPQYASDGAAGFDLSAAIEEAVSIQPCTRVLVPTGIIVMIPNGYEGQVRPRSGLALKYGISVLNSPGTIDADYRGEIKVILINHGNQTYSLSRGERIAQLVVSPICRVILEEVTELTKTIRGEGGFGSTG